MKMIKPIVNISKIVDNYDTVILGYNGVLTGGSAIYPEAAQALAGLRNYGKNIILLSNTSQRVASLAKYLQAQKIPLNYFDGLMTAGEILHYKLKAGQGDFAAIGSDYYHLGSAADEEVFQGLSFRRTHSLETAHFIYMSAVSSPTDLADHYLPQLEHAAALGLPFVCAGNDTSCFMDDKIALAPGALAEQYAIMGGRIITLGKPDPVLFKYCLDAVANPGAVLVIGDNAATDIKGAELLGLDSVLISKGVHVNFLGEGYIPDVAKTRELSHSFDASPDFVISNLRW